jgi:hypothetical protein
MQMAYGLAGRTQDSSGTAMNLLAALLVAVAAALGLLVVLPVLQTVEEACCDCECGPDCPCC